MDFEKRIKLTQEEIDELKRAASEKHGISSAISYMTDEELAAVEKEKQEKISQLKEQFSWEDESEENGENGLPFPESNELKAACSCIAEWASKNITMDNFIVDEMSFSITVPTDVHPVIEKICDKQYSYDSVCFAADGLTEKWDEEKDSLHSAIDVKVKELFPATGKWKPTILLSDADQKVSDSTGTPLERMGVYDSFLLFDDILELNIVLDKND